jgi:hypothetical protein
VVGQFDRDRVSEAITRQRQRRSADPVPLDAIVADLSAGFWTALLAGRYDVPFSWRYNLARVLPKEPKLTRAEASKKCDALRELRNRIAHHEPILHLPLSDHWDDIKRLVDAMCPGAGGLFSGDMHVQRRPERPAADGRCERQSAR